MRATKGALASVKSIQGSTYVRSCSGLGTVSVTVNGKSIELNPGEEVLVTNHKPDESEIRPGDGLAAAIRTRACAASTSSPEAFTADSGLSKRAAVVNDVP